MKRLILNVTGSHGDTEGLAFMGLRTDFEYLEFVAEAKQYTNGSRTSLLNRLVQLSLIYDEIYFLDGLFGIEEHFRKLELWEYCKDQGLIHTINYSLGLAGKINSTTTSDDVDRLGKEITSQFLEHVDDDMLQKEHMKAKLALAEAKATGRGCGSFPQAIGWDQVIRQIYDYDLFKASFLEHVHTDLARKVELNALASLLDADLSNCFTEYYNVRPSLIQKYNVQSDSRPKESSEKWKRFIYKKIHEVLNNDALKPKSEFELTKVFFEDTFPEFLPRTVKQLDKVRNSSDLIEFREMLSETKSPEFIYDYKLASSVKGKLEKLQENESRYYRLLHWSSALGGLGIGFIEPLSGFLTPIVMESIGRKLIHSGTKKGYEWAYLFIDNVK